MKETSPLKSRRIGFTLVEMLVVMAIIMLLMSLVVGIFNAVGNTSLENRAKAELADLMNELELYFAEEGSYPLDWTEFNTWYTNEYPGTVYTLTDGDPGNPLDPWGEQYRYAHDPAVPFVYVIGSFGPNMTDDGGEVDDITNRNGEIN